MGNGSTFLIEKGSQVDLSKPRKKIKKACNCLEIVLEYGTDD